MSGTVRKKRLVILLVFVGIAFLLLLIRIGYWTFYKGEWLQAQAESQWTQDNLVAAERGSILDRNGNVLAQSASADTVLLRPKQVKDADRVADSLAAILDMDREGIYEKATDPEKSELWVKRQISREQADQIRALDLDGVYFTTDVKRYYPNKDLLCQVVGFTSVDGEGLSGLEKQYDKYLSGTSGRVIAETDKNGRELAAGYEFNIQPENGYDVVLSIDAVIQSFLEKACVEAYEASGAKGVQGIVMDPNSGEILAMANIPGYDLNDPPRNDADALQELSINKVTAETYEPGSAFQFVTAAAALDSGATGMDSTYDCTGSVTVDGQRIECTLPAGHGTENLMQAMQNACCPFFAQTALNMGTATFYDYINRFGFGQETGIDYISDQPGLVLDQKYVKNTDLAYIGIGQNIDVTTLQMACAASAAVNGGTLYQPRLVTALMDADGNIVQQFEPVSKGQALTPETSSLIKQLLKDAMDTGTGKNAQIYGYSVGGQAGTGLKKDEGDMDGDGEILSSFMAFAPAEAPEYLVLILVDEPGISETDGGVIAAPYVKEVLEQTLTYGNIPPETTEDTEDTATVTVPDVTGMDAEEAKAQIESLGLTCTVEGSGDVLRQLPLPEEVVAEGSLVTLYTEASASEQPANNDDLAQVPDVTGMTMTEARDALEAAGFEIDIRSSGRAVRQSPGADEYAEKGSKITVYFALDLNALKTDDP